MKIYNKLIRDRIPEIIAASGKEANVRVLGGEELEAALREKVVEEALEIKQANEKELVAEIADLYEVLESLLKHKGIAVAEVRKFQRSKKEERGGFDSGLLLTSVG